MRTTKNTRKVLEQTAKSVAILPLICLFVYVFYYLHRPGHFRTENRLEDIEVSPAAYRQPLSGSIFTFVTTSPRNYYDRVPIVNATWLRRLDHGVFFTSTPLPFPEVPYRTVFAGFDDSYFSLFHKTKFGFYYAFKHVSGRFDWYMKADDDAYIVAENLRAFLAKLDPEKPIYAGFRMKPHLEHGFNSGSAYVLSRAAVRMFAEELYNNSALCPHDKYEDVGMARCLASKGVYPIPTRDSADRGRFHIFDAFKVYRHSDEIDYAKWYKDHNYDGFDEFSKELITLHHMRPQDMITADLFLYRVKLAGEGAK